MKFNKFLWVGVLVGILVTLGVQYGTKMYQKQKLEKEFTAFDAGYTAAKDKAAYVTAFVAAQKGTSVSVGVSTSKADSGECDSQWGDYKAINQIYQNYMTTHKGTDDYSQDIADELKQLAIDAFNSWRECYTGGRGGGEEMIQD